MRDIPVIDSAIRLEGCELHVAITIQISQLDAAAIATCLNVYPTDFDRLHIFFDHLAPP